MIFNPWKKRKVGSDKTQLVSKNATKKEDTINFKGIKLDEDNSPSLLGKEIKIIGKISSQLFLFLFPTEKASYLHQA